MTDYNRLAWVAALLVIFAWAIIPKVVSANVVVFPKPFLSESLAVPLEVPIAPFELKR